MVQLYFSNHMPLYLQNNKAETLSQNHLNRFNKIFTKMFVYDIFSLMEG